MFFGDPTHSQKPMQTAFLLAVLARLRLAGVPSGGWAGLFNALAFSTASWDFTSWVRSLHGREATSSASIARSVLTRAFMAQQLPAGVSGVPDILRGNGASITLVASPLTPSGRPSQNQAARVTLKLSRGQTTAQGVDDRRHIKMVEVTDNIGTVGVFDRQSPPGSPVRYRLDRGILLDPASFANPLLLDFHMQNYGGNESTAQLDISWK